MFTTLLRSEALQANATTYRAAALFPILDLDQVNLILAFDNYWDWKRSIAVTYSFAIRDKGGELLFKSEPACPRDVNLVSIREIIEKTVIDCTCASGGSVEIEIRSAENIQFPFPAILAYYEDSFGRLSVVHSSGRTLEAPEPTVFSEGGFYISHDSDYQPFLHVFNGGFGSVTDLRLRFSVFVENDCKIFEFPLDPVSQPYESKILYLDKYLESPEISCLLPPVSKSSDGIDPPVVVVHLIGKCTSIYPRFVCGNILSSSGLPFVAHTFREVTSKTDILDLNTEPALPRLRLPPLPEPLQLAVTIYPFAYPNQIKVNISESSDLESNVLSSKSLSVSPVKDVFCYKKVSRFDSSLFVDSSEENWTLPARLSCNLSVFFKEHKCSAFTDIALGVNRASSKLKLHYWFTFLLKPGFSQFIIGSSYFLDVPSIDFELVICLPAQGGEKSVAYSHVFSFEGQSFCLSLDDVFRLFSLDRGSCVASACSVILKMRNNTKLDHVVCLGYNREINSIFAEHSF